METLHRWVSTLKWLANHPPTNIANTLPEDTTCDYCGKMSKDVALTRFESTISQCTFIVCFPCCKKVLDTVLKKKSKSL